MKKPDITPGPWSVHPDPLVASDVWVEQEDGVRRFIACCPEGPKRQRQAIQDEWAVNARLIASAPDLLEALRQIVVVSSRRMAEGGDIADFQDTNRRAGDIARAAIARSTT